MLPSEGKMGVSENGGYLILGVLIIRILLFRVLYLDPLFLENSQIKPDPAQGSGDLVHVTMRLSIKVL